MQHETNPRASDMKRRTAKGNIKCCSECAASRVLKCWITKQPRPDKYKNYRRM